MKNPVIKAGYDVNESWQKGTARMHDVRQAGFKIHQLAKNSRDIKCIVRQHNTIPKHREQRSRNRHCGNVHNRLFRISHKIEKFSFYSLDTYKGIYYT